MPSRRIPAQSFDALVGHGDGLGGLRARGALALVLLSALVLVSPLAWASPPDQGWLPGIYDGADYDDVVGLLTETGALDRPPVALAPHSGPPWLRASAVAPAPSDASVQPFHLRSPPGA